MSLRKFTWLPVLAGLALFAACDEESPTSVTDAVTTPTTEVPTTPEATEPATGPTFSDALFTVTYTLVEGNANCADLGYDNGFKVDKGCPEAAGTYSNGDPGTTNTVGGPFPGEVTIVCNTDTNIDWTSTFPIDAVLVKAGPNTDVYTYDPESNGDDGLDGTSGGVSHVEFCYDYELIIEKTAEPGESSCEEDWTITKDVDDDSHTGFPGDDFTSNYTVEVNHECVEASQTWEVNGSITITNPAATGQTATVTSIQDVLTKEINGLTPVDAEVICPSGPLPFDLAAGDVEVCEWSAEVGNIGYDLNTVTVVATGVEGGDATAGFNLTGVLLTIETIFVEDCFDGDYPGFPDSGDPDCDPIGSADDDFTFPDYPRDFLCPDYDGQNYEGGVETFQVPNRAFIVDSEDDFDDENVTVTCYLPAKARVIKTTVEGSEDIGQFPIQFELYDPTDTKVETVEITAAGTSPYTLNFTTEIEDGGTWTVVEILPDGWVATNPASPPLECTFDVAFPDAADETFVCEFANTEKSRVTVYKLTQGQPTTTAIWTFNLYEGPDGFDGTLIASDATPPALLDFGDVDLSPFETYTLCELEVPAGFSSRFEWMVDGTTVIPYNPNLDDVPPEDFGNRCVDFGDNTLWPLVPGEILPFQVDNSQPGGAPRTPGYWKNWNRCTGGGQQYTADANGGPDEGFWLVDDIIEPDGVYIGDYWIEDCEDAVALLDKRDTRGKKKASDPFINLATSLLAAQLNFAAGACTTADVQQWALAAQTLLDEVGFEGDALGKRADGADQAQMLQEYLDDYNNGMYCGDGFD